MAENSPEVLAVGWFYSMFPEVTKKQLERTIRRAANFEEAKRTVRLCFTGDWVRQGVRLRINPQVSIYEDARHIDVQFKDLDWGVVTSQFWDRLRKRNYHYSQIHTVVYERNIGIFTPTRYSYIMVTDDIKIIRDEMKSHPTYKMREILSSVPSKNKLEEFDAAVEKVKRCVNDPNYKDEFSRRDFGYYIAIGCRIFQTNAVRPLYEFESRY